MKSFLIKLIIFFIPVCTFISLVEFYIRHVPSAYQQKRDQLLENADSIKVLILGSSGEMDGINPNEMSLYAHNLAFGSQTIYFDKRLAEKYVPYLYNLKFVIIDLNYTSLNYEHAPERDFFYHYYYGIDYEGRKFCKENFLQSMFVYPPKQIFLSLYNDLKNPLGLVGKKGWLGGSDDYMTESIPEFEERVRHFYVENQKGKEERDCIIKDIDSLIVFLKSRDIMPILVTPPYYKGFRSLLDDKKPFIEHDSISNYITQKYNITHLNYFYDDSFDIYDFHNYNHLNIRGASKLTQKINAYILKEDSLLNS